MGQHLLLIQTMAQQKEQKVQSKFAFKYEFVKGDLFTCPDTSSMCHCVAQDLGMGKGIATLFKRKFGGFNELKQQRARVGECAVLDRKGRYVYYMITKKRSNQKPTYQTIESSIRYMKNHAVINGVSHISMPKIGCGLDRLQWNKVKKIVKNEFKDTNVKITVYEL